MNEFHEKSTLLVACPEYCNDGTSKFNIWPSFVHTHTPLGNLDKVQIIFLNCNKNAIVQHVQEIIADLKKEPQELEVMEATLFFERTLKKIGEEQTAPLYNRLRARAEKIVGPAYTQNSVYVHLDKATDFAPIL